MYQAGYGSALYQNVAYIRRLSIMLAHALSVKATFDGHFIIIGFVVVEIFAFFRGNTLVGRALGGTAH